TLNFMITGFPIADTTPWPVNLARKGTVAFADLTTFPSTPTAITPTTPASDMSGFPGPTPINRIMAWRNSATTLHSAPVFFDNPTFPLALADNFARYFLGGVPPFSTPFTTVSTAVQNERTDQPMMTRQELIRLQRTLCTDPATGSYDDSKLPQSLLQYLGTFSREHNRPAPSWSQLSGALAATRWDMNNLQIVIPAPWFYPGNHGQGHAYGTQRWNSDLTTLFGLVWVRGNFATGARFTDPNYYGHWKYVGKLKAVGNDPPLQGDTPDFFQIIDYAMTQAAGPGPTPANHMSTTFTVGAAIIDQYDTDDLHDSPSQGSQTGNTITIIDYLNDGNPFAYAYGVERMSYDDPNQNQDRPPFAPGPVSPPLPPPTPALLPPQANYAFLNRRFENVGDFGYAYNPASDPTRLSRTLDFASATSNDKPLLDFFTYNTAGNRAGIVNLNT